MIFYFSGTGNSQWVANQINHVFDGEIIPIAPQLQNAMNDLNYQIKKDEKIFFVFPIHSWGPAVLILQFIEKMKLEGYTDQPVYFIATCGDDCGYTTKIIQKSLGRKGINFTKGYSIQMPNNYILMKGFNTDTKEEEQRKLKEATHTLEDIIKNIKHQDNKQIYSQGTFPFLKSRIVYPFFKKFSIGSNPFRVKENCISCNLCEHVCPTKTITMVDGKPVWNKTCVQCTACIHRCPVQAIEYGKVSVNKGRYHHPDVK